MRAFLAIGNNLLQSRSNHDAGIFGCGIREQFHFSDGDLVQTRDPQRFEELLKNKPASQKNPEIADKHSEAGEDQKLRELSARDVLLSRALDGKLIAP